jgi:hypothetical protein
MAVRYSSKLNAIESIETPGFPIEERSNIIDALINSSRIKEILVSRHPNIPAEKDVVYNKGLITSAAVSRIVNQVIKTRIRDRQGEGRLKNSSQTASEPHFKKGKLIVCG